MTMNLPLVSLAFLVGLSVFVSETRAQEQAGVLTVRSFRGEDIVDGKINYSKVLGDKSVWSTLEISDEQRTELESLANEFFETRRNVRDELWQAISDSDLSRKDKIAAGSISDLDMEVPMDVEARLSQILLPHQMEFLHTYLPLRFLLHSIQHENIKDESRQYAKSLGTLLGVSGTEARTIAKESKKIQQGFQNDIRKILFEEIESAVKLLDGDQRDGMNAHLGMEKERADLLEVDDLRSLIARRIAWQNNKNYSIQIPHRSEFKFATRQEKAWLQLTDAQFEEITTVFMSSLKEKWEAGQPADQKNKDRLVYSFKGYTDDTQRLKLERNRLTELYELSRTVLLPHQVEELRILDRWCFLNVRSFTEFLKTSDFELDNDEVKLKKFSDSYREVLQLSIDKLTEIQKLQHDKLVERLPNGWKEKLQRIGTDNF